MASNGSRDHATRRLRRRRILLLIGLLLVALAGWRVASRTAFADRAVTAPAVIDELDQGPFLASEDGRRSFTVYATVRYQVDGTPTRGRVALGGCRAGACPASRQRGETIAIAYDPQQVSRVEVASRVAGWYPLLDPWVLGLALIGVGVLVAAAAIWCGDPEPGSPHLGCRRPPRQVDIGAATNGNKVAGCGMSCCVWRISSGRTRCPPGPASPRSSGPPPLGRRCAAGSRRRG
jgi:hypothetical protein